MVDRTENIVTEIINETYFIDGEVKGAEIGYNKRELRGFYKTMQTISGSLQKSVAEKALTEIHIDMEYGI